LNTDPAIRPLVVQFVPLKIETQGDQWGKWARRYPHEGNGIPIIYVIRADGEKLYGRTGSLGGDALPQMMREALTLAGRVLNEQEATLVATAVAAARKAIEDKDPPAAMKALAGLKKIGPLGDLGSRAKPAVEADELVKTLAADAKAKLEDAKTKLTGAAPEFEAALALVEVNRAFAVLPELKAPLAQAQRDANRNAAARELLDQAEALDRARLLASLPGGKPRAVAALKQLAARYPNTPAAKAALEDAVKLDPAAGEATAGKPPAAAETPGAGSTAASDEKKAASYLRMAKTFAASRPDKAREYAEKAIEAAPDSDAGREAKTLLEKLK
jgi:hypothetical protein